jgi:hypothetical protein
MQRRNFAASVEVLQSYREGIETEEAKIAQMQENLEKSQQGVDVVKKELREELASAQDSLFQSAAYPANYLAGEEAREYVDHMFALTGNPQRGSMQALSPLGELLLPGEGVQVAYFEDASERAKPFIKLFRTPTEEMPSLVVQNYKPGMLTFADDIENPATVFGRGSLGVYGDYWSAGLGHKTRVSIDMSARDLTITEDPERAEQALESKRSGSAECIIAIGVEAVSAAIDHSRQLDLRHDGENQSDILMKRILARISGEPISAKSLDVPSLQAVYYDEVRGLSASGRAFFDNSRELPLILHGDLFEDIFPDGFDFQRYDEVLSEAHGRRESGIYLNWVKEKFDAVFDGTGDIDAACREVVLDIVRSFAYNRIVQGIGSGAVFKDSLADPSKGMIDSLALVKAGVAAEALKQSKSEGKWANLVSGKSRKLKRYVNHLND